MSPMTSGRYSQPVGDGVPILGLNFARVEKGILQLLHRQPQTSWSTS